MQRGRLFAGIRLWGVRRNQAASIVGAILGAALLAVLFMWQWVIGAVTIGAAGIVYFDSRLLNTQAPWRPPGSGWFFGGELLAYAALGAIRHPRQRQVIDQLAGEYKKGETVELLVWVTSTDQTGQRWTLVQDQYGLANPMVTASVVGQIPGACDPYVEAAQLVMSEIGVRLEDVTVLGWGLDWSGHMSRDVIVVIGQTRAPAFTPTRESRSWQLVELHPDSVARTLTRFDARRWQAAAVWGLAACLDLDDPKGRTLLEASVVDSWKSKRMFKRLDRLTEGVSVDPPPTLVVDPVVVSAEHGVVAERRPTRPRATRALAWERPTQRIPTRYG